MLRKLLFNNYIKEKNVLIKGLLTFYNINFIELNEKLQTLNILTNRFVDKK